jgi:hypothetical protein
VQEKLPGLGSTGQKGAGAVKEDSNGGAGEEGREDLGERITAG